MGPGRQQARVIGLWGPDKGRMSPIYSHLNPYGSFLGRGRLQWVANGVANVVFRNIFGAAWVGGL